MKKSLLILTGHSKGLGRAILDRFLFLENYQVLALSRTQLDLQHPDFMEVPLDLSDLSRLEDNLPGIFPEGEFERIVLINNAGWIGEIKSTGTLSSKGIEEAFHLNLLAPMMIVNAFVRAYGDHQGKKIICNISSGAAHKPLSGWAEYCSSKAGLAMFSQVAALDLEHRGFRVFSLAPGIVDTEMQAEIRSASESDFPALMRFKDYKDSNRLSSTEEVSAKISYLIAHTDLFAGVIQDVRDFDLP